MKMKAINFHKEAAEDLDLLAKITGLTLAEMIRRATDEYVRRELLRLSRKQTPVSEAAAV